MTTPLLSAAVIATTLVVAIALSAQAQTSGKTPAAAPRYLTGTEAQKVIAGNTLSGTIKIPNGSDVHHDLFFAADGTVRGRSRVGPPLSYDNTVNGAWAVDRGQFCFHDATAIVWSCPRFQRRSDSELQLFDSSGRPVTTLRITPGNPRRF